MGCGKLVFAILLAVFVAQKNSSASPIQQQPGQGQPPNAASLAGLLGSGALNGQNLQNLAQQIQARLQAPSGATTNSQPENEPAQNSSIDTRLFNNCMGEANDLLTQQTNFVPQSFQGVTNSLVISNYFALCMQEGFSTVTARCLQNVATRVQDILSTSMQQGTSLMANYGTALNRLVTCVARNGL